MTIQQGQTTVFKKNCLSGLENFASGTSYVYKIALYTANADLSYSTLTYTTSEEISGTGYTAGGQTLTPIVPASSGQTAYVSFNNAVWNPAAFTCRGALIYNSTTSAAVAVLDFGSDKTCSGTFTVTFPTADATDAIIRFS
jgi:hypothetical protein